MSKLLLGAAAIGVVSLVALTAPAGATERRADGMRNADQIEVSSVRRYRRYYYGPRYYRPRAYYGGPYYGYDSYAYSPSYYRPYYRPGPHIGVGPGGVSFGFGF